ncbi:MAG: response regulator transcription factor [Saprospiraceae bacterium]|nr:response regulator transcription factor [Saprospiraceae bacterium]
MHRQLDILVADPQPIFAEGLRSLLSGIHNEHFSYHIKGVANSGAQVSEFLESQQPDLFLLDPDLPDTEGLKILAAVKQNGPKTRILVLNGSLNPTHIQAAFRAGADGYMLKSGSEEELLLAVGELAEGRTFVGRGIMPVTPVMAPDSLPADRRFAKEYKLTQRELEVLKLIGQALSNKEISERIFISDQTASVHRKNIMRKLKVNSTGALIKIAFENGLV